MQIHELNNFTGTLGAGAYLAIDDGNDTGKISSQGLLAATEARIDNIIAGPAPSAEEIVDARLGADGVTYPSLGDAIRDQFTDVKAELNEFISEMGSSFSYPLSSFTSGKLISYGSVGTVWSTSDNANSVYTATPIDVSQYRGEKIIIKKSAAPSSSSRYIGFVDADGKWVATPIAESELVLSGTDGAYIAELPIAGDYFVASFSTANTSLEIQAFKAKVPRGEVDEIEADIEDMNKYIGFDTPTYVLDNNYSASSNRIIQANRINSLEDIKSISINAVSGFDTTLWFGTYPSGTAPFGWNSSAWEYVNDGTYENFWVGARKSDNSSVSDADLATFEAGINVTITKKTIFDDLFGNSNVAFVATTGNDSTGDGTKSKPYASVNKALSENANVICISEGIYNQSIDLNNSQSPTVEIRNISQTGRVIFKPLSRLLINGESLLSGYTKVYQASLEATIDSNQKWLWQENVPDASTLITDEERHPAQRGLSYRLEDTKIVKCTSAILSDALAEIESADSYKWFYDTDNDTLYFSRPQAVDSSHTISGATEVSNLIANASRSKSLKMYGIETKYAVLNVDYLTNPVLYDCRAMNVFGAGAITYNRAIGAKFERCEAASCQYSGNGDGINAHSVTAGDPKASQTTVEILDCWAHDNNDDGYSDHERCETIIRGGLYEWNQKGGVVPSYGDHCSCFDVMSRHNQNGFYLTGAATEAEGGKYSQLICYNCIAIANTRASATYGRKGWRVDGTGNKAILIGCKSIDNIDCGFYASAGCSLELTDCGSIGDSTLYSGDATIKNTALVE